MVKLGEYSACPQIITTAVEAIVNSIREKLSHGLPVEHASKVDIDFEDILFVDWWAEAGKARHFRLTQNLYGSVGKDGTTIQQMMRLISVMHENNVIVQ
jgi:hypothetical protein